MGDRCCPLPMVLEELFIQMDVPCPHRGPHPSPGPEVWSLPLQGPSSTSRGTPCHRRMEREPAGGEGLAGMLYMGKKPSGDSQMLGWEMGAFVPQ